MRPAMARDRLPFRPGNKAFVYELARLLRIKQWIKNLFVFAGLLFSRNMFNIEYMEKSAYAFFCFCLVSSCVYIINDLIDVEKDRNHPLKKCRPLVTGTVSRFQAYILLSVFAAAGLVLTLAIGGYLWLVILAYIVNNLLYSFILKNTVILDVMSIALGFLLRVVAGVVVLNVEMSQWLVLCGMLLALFLGFGKRRNELFIMRDDAAKHRRILTDYSPEFIDNMLSIVTACTVMAYSLYTFNVGNNKNMMFTIPFVLYGIFRYQYLVYKKNEGGSPETIVLKDMPLLLNVIVWVLCCTVLIYLG